MDYYPPPKRATTDDDTDSDMLDSSRFIEPQVQIIEPEKKESFNDVVTEKVIRLSEMDISRLKTPVTDGLIKIFVGEIRKAFGRNALQEHLE